MDDNKEGHQYAERRQGYSEIIVAIERMMDKTDEHIQSDTAFHESMEKKFDGFFGEIDGPTHKKHHTWIKGKITEEEARQALYDKIKVNLINQIALVVGGAVLMYIGMSIWKSATVDVYRTGQQQYEQQYQGKTPQIPDTLPAQPKEDRK